MLGRQGGADSSGVGGRLGWVDTRRNEKVNSLKEAFIKNMSRIKSSRNITRWDQV